ncbi:MAG TPA: hypothetical protein DHW16_02835 [Ruminococcaceae bacterium]|nr:hypothetical protein [Oscillospiraceae bacterium]HCO37256.1 hypothetical protein [Oscillospiraceae bacterium]
MDNVNINDILSSLSNEDIEMLKGVAGSILNQSDMQSSAQQQKPPQSTPQSAPQDRQSLPPQINGLNFNSDDFAMIMKAKSIFDRMNKTSSKNADLINALKPHLSEQSRQKADQAIRILKLFDMLPYLKDLF